MLRRDIAINLGNGIRHGEKAFIAAVAREVDTKRLPRAQAEQLVIAYYQNIFWLFNQLAFAVL